MKIITWYYPDNPAEAAGLSESDKVFLHSGGTGLLMSNLKGVQGLVDLNKLPLKTIHSEKGLITFGSLCTYADVVSYFKKRIRIISWFTLCTSPPVHLSGTGLPWAVHWPWHRPGPI